jgi:hypothetical protein
MKYKIPQFLDIEDKIFGQLSFKQFLYIAGCGALAYLCWVLPIPKIFSGFLVAAFIIFGVSLAFYKVNNRPFIVVVEDGMKFYLSSKLYIWKKAPSKLKNKDLKKEEINPLQEINMPRVSGSRLKELSWGLDIKQKIDEVGDHPEQNFGLRL